MRFRLAWIGLLAVSCETGPGATMMTARDSAGVNVTMSAGSVWNGTNGWRIDANPVITIGAVDGAPEYTLNKPLAVRAFKDAIVVVERDEIRVFDQNGKYLRSIGRAGSGPGEFVSIATAEVCAGKVYTSDLGRATAVVYDVNGRLVGEFWDIRQNGGAIPMLAGCARDGLIVYPGRPPDPSTPRDRTVREPIPLLYVDQQLGVIDTAAAPPGMEVYNGLRRPFGRMSLWAVGDSLLYVIDTGVPEVRVLSLSGTLLRIHRLPLEPAPVTPADIERVREEEYLSGMPPRAIRQIVPLLEAVGFPETQPLFDDIRVDPNGNVWLEAYQKDSSAARSWYVLSPEGRWLGVVPFPQSFSVHAFTNDGVLGVWTNDLGVEFVRWYHILKFEE